LSVVVVSRRPSLLSRLTKSVIMWFYRRQGWTEFNENPGLQKCVVIAAPHTSNWDFVYFIGAITTLELPMSFVGKKTLFRWPFRQAMIDMGGVPVDRSKSTNFVDTMIAEFAARDTFMLTIAPEGTRSAVQKWKTGFYHIAVGAGVPMVLGMMDYKRKVVGLAGAIMPTGDYVKDMEKLAAFYATCTPKFPRQAAPDFGAGA
jgi:1-acyl-sn-glycerol-3-phosphate acyltransferase